LFTFDTPDDFLNDPSAGDIHNNVVVSYPTSISDFGDNTLDFGFQTIATFTEPGNT